MFFSRTAFKIASQLTFAKSRTCTPFPLTLRLSSLCYCTSKKELPNFERRKGDYHHTYYEPEAGNGFEKFEQLESNYVPLTPISFLERTAYSFGNKTSIIHGNKKWTWEETHLRCHKLASAFQKHGIKPGDTISIIMPNIPQNLESHFGILLCGGVMNSINYRLEPKSVAFILKHAESKILLVDKEYSVMAQEALKILKKENPEQTILIIDVDDRECYNGEGTTIGNFEYEQFLQRGTAKEMYGSCPKNEWQTSALSYTSGTTGDPKGVLYSHRGTYLTAVGNAITVRMGHDTNYLWTLPLFHCAGWCFPYTVTHLGGTHVCLRAVKPDLIFDLLKKHEINHMCAAPVVLNMMASYAEENKIETMKKTVQIMTAGAPPPPSVLESIMSFGFDITHTYGLTETYGPAVANVWQNKWDKRDDKFALMVRQGVTYPVQQRISVRCPGTNEEVKSDGQTIGEVVMRGNIVMKGYYKNDKATKESFRNGWFWTGDLGVLHPDGYIELKDRAKDIIISGGENISSVEIESVIYKHPAVSLAAVVARKSEKWGETPVAYIELKPDHSVTEKEIKSICRAELAGFKCPTKVIFTKIPTTITGKIQKFKLRQDFASLKNV